MVGHDQAQIMRQHPQPVPQGTEDSNLCKKNVWHSSQAVHSEGWPPCGQLTMPASMSRMKGRVRFDLALRAWLQDQM